MYRILLTIFLSVLLASCANLTKKTKLPNGKWILINQALLSKIEPNNKSQEEWEQAFDDTMNRCESEASKIDIPKPKCAHSLPIDNCQSAKSFSSNFCAKPIINRTCDIKSTQQYKNILFANIRNCMRLSGWQWLPKGTSNQPLQEIIDTIPELVDWQKNHPEKWKLVTVIDNQLAELPKYQKVPTRERLLEVVKRVKQGHRESM